MPIFCKYESVPRTYHYCPEEHCQFWCQKTSKESRQTHYVLTKERLLELHLLAEEEHLEQPGQGLQENFEIFYVVLIGPFVKFHHLIHIHVTSVLPGVKYWRGGGG